MTATAARMLSDFETLAPDEQLLVRQRVVSLTEKTQREAIAKLKGCSQGEHLLEKLLIDRAKEHERE